jgi:mannan endo-1,4-beta-mannosidase
VASTIDLDPAPAGQQKSITVTGGTFALQADGTVVFTSTTGFFGAASASYTIQDKFHRTSNVATLSVFVKPPPPPPYLLASFEPGTTEVAWSGNVAISTDWASLGTHSLLINPVSDWSTNVWYNTPIDLTNNYTAITFDAYDQSSTAWGYLKLAIKDSAGHWCDNGGVSLQTNDRGPMTMSINLTSCGAWNGMLQQMLFYSSGNAYVDNFVAM